MNRTKLTANNDYFMHEYEHENEHEDNQYSCLYCQWYDKCTLIRDISDPDGLYIEEKCEYFDPIEEEVIDDYINENSNHQKAEYYKAWQEYVGGDGV